VITLECDPVDDRIFDDVDDQRIAFSPNRHVLEQAGCEQLLQPSVDPLRIENVSRPDPEIGEYGFVLDALRSLDSDRLDGTASDHRGLVLSNGNASCKPQQQRGQGQPQSPDRMRH
jgi:hypothetical protein